MEPLTVTYDSMMVISLYENLLSLKLESTYSKKLMQRVIADDETLEQVYFMVLFMLTLIAVSPILL